VGGVFRGMGALCGGHGAFFQANFRILKTLHFSVPLTLTVTQLPDAIAPGRFMLLPAVI
jgi:hypothetical protein